MPSIFFKIDSNSVIFSFDFFQFRNYILLLDR